MNLARASFDFGLDWALSDRKCNYAIRSIRRSEYLWYKLID